jgi:hypothetical protein
MKLNKIIQTTIREFLNEQNNVEINLNDDFWKWFGNSKVVDENGNPMIYFHGTANNFNEFMVSDRGAIWFSPSDIFANIFADWASNPEKNKHPKILNVFIKSENPFDYENSNHIEDLILKLANFRFLNKKNGDVRTINDFINILNSYKDDFKSGIWTVYEKIMNIDTFIKLGYDGVYMLEFNKKNIAIFKPNQIKSTNNDGTWNIEDNNIYS